MADTSYKAGLTRPHWGGAASDNDIHLEVYDNEVDSRFHYSAVFLSLSTQRSTADRSNTYRIDRLNTSTIKGRKSGEALDNTPVRNDKLNIVVDTVLYIRNPIDYQDDWTAPDFLTEMGQNNGTEFAAFFDQAHLIQLIKSRTFVAPDHLKPAFSDGLEVVATVKAAAVSQAELEANAIAIHEAHKRGVTELVKRKVPLGDQVTLVAPDIYSMLVEHPKLLNMEFNVDASDYGGRRVVRMNGIPVVENTEFPTGAISAHPLGSAFNVSAEDAKCQMVTFSKTKALVTVEAHPFTSRIWDDKKEFCNVLDCYAMYTVGQRRPDTVVVTKFVEPPVTP